MFDAILTPRVLAIIGLVCLCLFAFAWGWAFFKVCYQKALGRPVPRNWLTNTGDVLAEMGNNLPGAINRGLKLAGKPGVFLPTQPAEGAPVLTRAELEIRLAETERSRDALMRAIEESQAPPRGLPGHASLGVLGLAVILLGIGASLVHCGPATEVVLRATPGVPDPTDCRPGVGRCLETPDGFIPVVCSHVETPDGRHREWSSLPRDPADGRQRTCLHGCVVDDRGAHCVGLGGAR